MILTDIRSQSRYFALGDSTSTEFSDADILRQTNSNYRQLVVLAMANSGDWQYRGNNSQTSSITAATRAYALPATYLRISRVEIKYPSSATNYQKATQIDYTKITSAGLDDYTAGVPEFDLKGDYLEIFVSAKTADITAVTNGIIVYYENEITALAAIGDEPDIPEPFSRLLCLMNAYDYTIVNSLNTRATMLKQEIIEEKEKFKEFIANRSSAKRSRIKFRKEDYSTDAGQADESVEW